MVDRNFSFERLLAPITPQDFLREYWEQKPLIVNRDRPLVYDSIMTFADLDDLLHIARESMIGLMLIVPPPGSGRAQSNFQGKEISVAAAYQAFGIGDTLRLSSVHLLWPSIAALRAAICEALDADVQVNAYVTPASAQGFSMHFDTHDALILQVDGSKDWYIYDRYIDAPIPTEANLSYTATSLYEAVAGRENELDLLGQIRLEKGDLLYLPRGFPHKAVATAEASLHLTVGIHPVYWVDLLKASMETVCLQYADLRRALPPGFISDPGIRSTMSQQFREILELASRNVDLDRTLDDLISLRIRKQAYPPDGHFTQIMKVAELGIDSVVRRRRGLDCRLFEQENIRGIAFAKSEVRGPAQVGLALRHICDHRRFRVRDLPGPLDDQSRLVLVRRLIREGLLQVEDGSPLA